MADGHDGGDLRWRPRPDHCGGIDGMALGPHPAAVLGNCGTGEHGIDTRGSAESADQRVGVALMN